MSSNAIATLRDVLQNFSASDAMSGRLSRDVAAAFRDQHADVVAEAAGDLAQIAIVQLINEVGKRRTSPAGDDLQAELFPGLRYPSTIAVGRTKVHKPFLLATFAEATEWNLRPTRETSELIRDPAVKAILAHVAPYATGDMTMGEAIEAAAQAEASAASGS